MARSKRKADTGAGVTDLTTVESELEPVRDALGEVLRFVTTCPLQDLSVAPYVGTSDTGVGHLSTFRQMARDQIDALEERRKSITDPITQAKRRVDDLFRPARESAEAVHSACTARLNEHVRAQADARRAAAEQLRMAPGDEGAAQIVHSAPRELPDGLTTVTRFAWEITDFSAVPDAYKVANEKAISAVATAGRGQVEIPGVRIYEVQTVRSA